MVSFTCTWIQTMGSLAGYIWILSSLIVYIQTNSSGSSNGMGVNTAIAHTLPSSTRLPSWEFNPNSWPFWESHRPCFWHSWYRDIHKCRLETWIWTMITSGSDIIQIPNDSSGLGARPVPLVLSKETLQPNGVSVENPWGESCRHFLLWILLLEGIIWPCLHKHWFGGTADEGAQISRLDGSACLNSILL